MTDKLIERIKAYRSAPTIYDAPDPVEMAKRILANTEVIERWRSMWEKEQAHNEQLAEALKAADELERLLRRYFTETPLGHQPHMIDEDTQKALAAYNEKRGERE